MNAPEHETNEQKRHQYRRGITKRLVHLILRLKRRFAYRTREGGDV